MTDAPTSFEDGMIALLPELRAFARLLVWRRTDADDLVQDTVIRMWGAQARFVPGTNMRAWAFRILRNRFLNAYTKARSTEDLDAVGEGALATPAMQERAVAGREIRMALARLDPILRETLALAIGSELPYDEVAAIQDCPVGTVKSRMFRARRQLRRLLRHSTDIMAWPADGDASPADSARLRQPAA